MSFAKYSTVLFASMIKFLGGPLAGLALKLSWYETAICTTIGMMITVSIIVFMKSAVLRFLKSVGFEGNKNKKRFSKTSRFSVKIRRKFGLLGISLLTPLIFSPAGGTFIALAFKYTRNEILSYMLGSAIVWSLVQTFFFFYLKDLIL